MGSVVSVYVNEAVVFIGFPHSSVAKKLTDTVPVPLHPEGATGVTGSVVHVISPQRSVAAAPPLLVIQLSNAVLFHHTL